MRCSVTPALLFGGRLSCRMVRSPSARPASSQRSPFALAAPPAAVLTTALIESLARGRRLLPEALSADSTVDWLTRYTLVPLVVTRANSAFPSRAGGGAGAGVCARTCAVRNSKMEAMRAVRNDKNMRFRGASGVP